MLGNKDLFSLQVPTTISNLFEHYILSCTSPFMTTSDVP